VQGLARARFGKPYHPVELRRVLSTGATPSKNPSTDRIGVMPNLAAADSSLAAPALDCQALDSSDTVGIVGLSQQPPPLGYQIPPTYQENSMPVVELSAATKNKLTAAIANLDVPAPPAAPTVNQPFQATQNKNQHQVHADWIQKLLSSDRAQADAALTEIGITGAQKAKVLHALEVFDDVGMRIYQRLEKEIAQHHSGPSGHWY
jgi:hypothetical protein